MSLLTDMKFELEAQLKHLNRMVAKYEKSDTYGDLAYLTGRRDEVKQILDEWFEWDDE